MSVDEMELVSRLKDVPPLRPQAYEHARSVLREAMADSGPNVGPVPQIQVPAQDIRQPRRRTVITRGRVGAGIGIGVAAAAVAVAVVATSVPQPVASPGRPPAVSPPAVSGAPSTSAKARPSAGSPSSVPVANPQLMSLASVIRTSGTPSGNATLIIRTQTNGSGSPQVNYDLYADNGAYYYGISPANLTQAVDDGDDQDNGTDAREGAAALYAAAGNLATARVRMINATPNPFGLGLDSAQKKAQAKQLAKQNAALRAEGIRVSGPDTGKALEEDYDNYVWNNSVDALTKGAGSPQVRAGVLRLLSTVPEVSVTNSTTDGQATLTLTAGKALFDNTTQDVLTINAKTGMPVSDESNVPGQPPSSATTYQVSRVTVADIAAGKS